MVAAAAAVVVVVVLVAGDKDTLLWPQSLALWYVKKMFPYHLLGASSANKYKDERISWNWAFGWVFKAFTLERFKHD